MDLEYRQFDFECKAVDDADDGFFRFEGSLSTYGNTDSYGDIILPGAFSKGLKTITPSLLWQHDLHEPVGVFEEIVDDEKRLFVKGKMPKSDTLVSGRIIPQMRIGSVRSMSVGMSIEQWDHDDKDRRLIKAATAWEGSLVTIPANSKAKITRFKSFSINDIGEIKTKRDFEKILRDSGSFSNKAIAYLASCLDESKIQSDSENKSTKAVDDALMQMKELTRKLKG